MITHTNLTGNIWGWNLEDVWEEISLTSASYRSRKKKSVMLKEDLVGFEVH